MTRQELTTAIAEGIYDLMVEIADDGEILSVATGALAAIESAGCVIVPREPTTEIVQIGLNAQNPDDGHERGLKNGERLMLAYRAMIAGGEG